VGLAQALIHNPQVLILDEPTSGLDPNQILEIRKLIKQISEQKTVILSTHIMQEVQALCDRVIVIHQGKIVADDLLKNLLSGKKEQVVLVVEWDGAAPLSAIESISGVEKVEMEKHLCRITTQSSDEVRAAIFRLSADRNLALLSFKVEENTLEDIFRSLTITSAAV
jgi:ABC-2 type transport system ATP-binding protein